KQSSGYIWIDSAPGKGTRVNVYLPRLEANEDSVSRDFGPMKNLQGYETVLIVEDEPLVRSLTATTLQNQGYAILEAGNGLEAIRVAIAYQGTIHLLLTDAIMPQMGGVELAGRLKMLRPGIRVVLASGYAQESLDTKHEQQEKLPFLQKPF